MQFFEKKLQFSLKLDMVRVQLYITCLEVEDVDWFLMLSR